MKISRQTKDEQLIISKWTNRCRELSQSRGKSKQRRKSFSSELAAGGEVNSGTFKSATNSLSFFIVTSISRLFFARVSTMRCASSKNLASLEPFSCCRRNSTVEALTAHCECTICFGNHSNRGASFNSGLLVDGSPSLRGVFRPAKNPPYKGRNTVKTPHIMQSALRSQLSR